MSFKSYSMFSQTSKNIYIENKENQQIITPETKFKLIV